MIHAAVHGIHPELVRTTLLPYAASVQATGFTGWRERYLRGQDRHKRLLVGLQLLYAGLLTVWLLFTHSWPAPDVVALFLLLFAFLTARGLRFLRDWAPFVLLLLGYVALTGIDGGLVSRAHIQFPIDVDRRLFFGHLPTVWLQDHLYIPGQARWYDYFATLLYPMHFIAPLVVAFIFWMWRPRLYWRFATAYLVLCYAAFITYVLYPMAPPWWAYNSGHLPAVHLIIFEVHYGGVSNPIVLATQFFKPNPVAAMPSLHAATPVLIWLVLWKRWPRWGWMSVAYPVAMAFSVVYMGEHYVVDVLAGALYAAAAFALVWGYHLRAWRGMWRTATGLAPARTGEESDAGSALTPPVIAARLCMERSSTRRAARRLPRLGGASRCSARLRW